MSLNLSAQSSQAPVPAGQPTMSKSYLTLTPRQNLVERFHQTLKGHMSKSGLSSADAALRLALQAVQSTINTVTGRTPSDLFLKGGYNTPLRSLRLPECQLPQEDEDEVRIANATAKSAAKATYNARHQVQDRQLITGDNVFVKEPMGNVIPATIISATAHDAVVSTADGKEERRHLDRIAFHLEHSSQILVHVLACQNISRLAEC